VGGGCVAGGKIYHGAKPGEGEIGHVRLERNGTIVEQRCSGWALDKKIRAVVQKHPSSRLAQATHGMERGEARALSAAADCPFTKQVLSEWGEDLAFGLSHVTHLLHPEVIVLGGGLALVGEPLRAAVESVLPRFVMEAFAPGPRVALSALREDAIPVGALLLAAAGLDQNR
jgi:glucokinase